MKENESTRPGGTFDRFNLADVYSLYVATGVEMNNKRSPSHVLAERLAFYAGAIAVFKMFCAMAADPAKSVQRIHALEEEFEEFRREMEEGIKP